MFWQSRHCKGLLGWVWSRRGSRIVWCRESLQKCMLHKILVRDKCCLLQVGSGISALQSLTKLTFLGLGCTFLSDRELEALRVLKNLRTLLANDTQITDDGEHSFIMWYETSLDIHVILYSSVNSIQGCLTPSALSWEFWLHLICLHMTCLLLLPGNRDEQRIFVYIKLCPLNWIEFIHRAQTSGWYDSLAKAPYQRHSCYWERYPGGTDATGGESFPGKNRSKRCEVKR